MKTDLFFVYGTLKRGYGNNFILSSSTFVQEDVTRDRYYLGDVGYPYAFPEYLVSSLIEDEYLLPVKGEVWEVNDPAVVRRLDALEGEGSHYHRRTVHTESGALVNIYEQLEPTYMGWTIPCNITTKGEWTWQR